MLMEKDWYIEMDKVNYETYDTDAVYDDMDGTSAAQKVITTVCRWYHFEVYVNNLRSMSLMQYPSHK